jgi:murein DD-endopeptidase MepM/ murein hydrolase activator NlpD
MAGTRTRAQRAKSWQAIRTLALAAVAVSTFQLMLGDAALAQTKAPSKAQINKSRTAPTAPAASAADVQSFAIVPDGSVAEQLVALRIDPTDAAKAAEAVTQAISQSEAKIASSGRAVLESQGKDMPKRLVTLQIYSNRSLAVDLARNADGSYGFKLAPGATETDDERVSSLPSIGGKSAIVARTLLPSTVTSIKATGATLAASLTPAGANPASVAELTKAVATTGDSAKIEVVLGRTADGTPRLLYASIGELNKKRAIWWFAPPNQPDGWFDESGQRIGGTALTDPTAGSRISSPFGMRRYYGRSSGGGFHNGIDFEGKTGQPIYAAADGVINHQGWYFNYGRTVKISHADNFETLYAHMSRFADGVGPGTHVRKGALIGYIGSTGRSTGPHLHFSAIVNGQFVDPSPYISQGGVNTVLGAESLVAYRQWQQDIRGALTSRTRTAGEGEQPRGLQGADPWSRNPFTSERDTDKL